MTPMAEPDRSGLDTVVPLVRAAVNRDDSNAWAAQAPLSDPSAPVIDRLVGSLIVLYAYDRRDGFQLVAMGDLDHLGVDRNTLALAAHDNLIDRMADLQLLERPDGCGMVRVDGNLEASTLLLPQLWADIAEILGGHVIVAVPTRDVVLFCGGGNESAMRALGAARDRALAVSDHQITTELLRFSAASKDPGSRSTGSWQIGSWQTCQEPATAPD